VFDSEEKAMKRTSRFGTQTGNSVSATLSVLGTFTEVTINCALAPTNVSYLFVAMKEWMTSAGWLLLQVVGFCR
jgi:hypothetical protein